MLLLVPDIIPETNVQDFAPHFVDRTLVTRTIFNPGAM